MLLIPAQEDPVFKGWKDGSMVKSTTFLVEDSGSVPSTHVEAHNYVMTLFSDLYGQ